MRAKKLLFGGAKPARAITERPLPCVWMCSERLPRATAESIVTLPVGVKSAFACTAPTLKPSKSSQKKALPSQPGPTKGGSCGCSTGGCGGCCGGGCTGIFAEPAPPLGGGLGCCGCMLALPAVPAMAPGAPPAPGVGLAAPTCPVPLLLPILLPLPLPSCTPFGLPSAVGAPLPVPLGTVPLGALALPLEPWLGPPGPPYGWS